MFHFTLTCLFSVDEMKAHHFSSSAMGIKIIYLTLLLGDTSIPSVCIVPSPSFTWSSSSWDSKKKLSSSYTELRENHFY